MTQGGGSIRPLAHDPFSSVDGGDRCANRFATTDCPGIHSSRRWFVEMPQFVAMLKDRPRPFIVVRSRPSCQPGLGDSVAFHLAPLQLCFRRRIFMIR
jgi:hypothetical protein